MSLRAIFHRTALSRTSARNFRPRLERLEDRDLLSTLVVTDPGDSGAKTLRGLLASAAAGDTIVFDPAVTSITLTSGALTVAKNLSVKGPAGRVRVARSSASGTPEFSVVLVNSGVTATLSGLTITGGFTLLGGGIDNVGTLTLDDVFVSANSGHSNFVSGVRTIGKGAGLYNAGNVTITNSSIDNNVGLSASDPANPTDPGGDAPFFGGGLYNAGGIVIVNLSYVTNNRISGSGGGFYNSGGTVAVFDSTLAGNIAQVPRAITSNGGVAWNASGTFVLTSDTLWSNAAEVGGALGNLGNMALVNCTLVNNALLAP